MEMVAPGTKPSQVECEFVRQANPKTPAGPAGTGVGVGVGAGVGVDAGVGVGCGGSVGESWQADAVTKITEHASAAQSAVLVQTGSDERRVLRSCIPFVSQAESFCPN